jgi:hypothetical protein
MKKIFESFKDSINENKYDQWYIEKWDKDGESETLKRYNDYDEKKIKSDFYELVTQLKPGEELHYMRDDKKYLGKFLLSIVNKNGVLKREVIKGSKTLYYDWDKDQLNESFESKQINENKFEIEDDYLPRMLDSYLKVSIWTSNDDEDNSIADNYTIKDLDKNFIKKSEKDCKEFLSKVEDVVIQEYIDATTLGHDFWLTRNHHGAGFFDRTYSKENEKTLTKEAQKFKEVNLYVENGKVLSESKNADGESLYFVWWKDKKHEIWASSLYGAKVKAIEQFKVPKSKQSSLAIMNADAYDKGDFMYDNEQIIESREKPVTTLNYDGEKLNVFYHVDPKNSKRSAIELTDEDGMPYTRISTILVDDLIENAIWVKVGKHEEEIADMLDFLTKTKEKAKSGFNTYIKYEINFNK